MSPLPAPCQDTPPEPSFPAAAPGPRLGSSCHDFPQKYDVVNQTLGGPLSLFVVVALSFFLGRHPHLRNPRGLGAEGAAGPSEEATPTAGAHVPWRTCTPEEQQGREGNVKCWAPAASSSWFCFRVINVPLNSARPWAPVSLAFNAISQAGGGPMLPATPITGGRGGWSPPAAPHSARDRSPPRATSPCILIYVAVPETAAHRPRSRRPFLLPSPSPSSPRA